MTHQERLVREEHQAVKKNMEGRTHTGKRKRHTTAYDRNADSENDSDAALYEDIDMHSSESRGADDEKTESKPGSSRTNPVIIVDSGFSTAIEQPIIKSVIGGALQRKPDGTVVAPRIVKKKVRVEGSSQSVY